MKCNYCKVEMRRAAYTDNTIYSTSEIYDVSEGTDVGKNSFKATIQ